MDATLAVRRGSPSPLRLSYPVILEGKMEKLWDKIRKMVSMETADCTPEQARDVVDYICNELTIYRDSIG